MKKSNKIFISASVIVALIILLNSFSKISESSDQSINWITDFAQLEALMKENPKPIMYDIHTKWCGPCNQMKKNVFSKAKIVDYLNENYYAVYLDAERKDDIIFRNKTFNWTPNRMGGYNAVADFVSDNQTEAYPTIVIMNKDFEVKYVEAGYHTVKDLYYVLNKHLN